MTAPAAPLWPEKFPPSAWDTVRVKETATLSPRDAVGRLWRVVVIQEGVSKNNWNYPGEVLARDFRVFEGVRVAVTWEALDHHDPVGVLRNVAAERVDGLMAITADAEIEDPTARTRLLEAYRKGAPYQFSIDANVRAHESRDATGRTRREVTAILEPTELTIVRRGAAGGRVQRLVASAPAPAVTGASDNSSNEQTSAGSTGAGTVKNEDEEEPTMAATAEKDPKIEAGAADQRATESENRVREALEGAARAQKAAEEALAKAKAEGEASAQRARESEFKALLTEKLAEVKGLPGEAKARVRESFIGADGKVARVVEAKEIDAAVEKERDYLKRVTASAAGGRITGCGEPAAEVLVEERDKIQAAMDGMLLGRDVPVRAKEGVDAKPGARVPRFKSILRAIENVENGGRRLETDEYFSKCLGWQPAEKRATESYRRARESLQVSSFAEILGDSVRRVLLDTFRADSKIEDVKRISSRYGVPLADYRENKRVKMGGYGLLSTVPEGGTYPTLTSPEDTQAVYTPAKKGGIEELTEEMILADDVGALQAIPMRLKEAAVETLYQDVFNVMANNSNIGDGSALFRTGNKTSSAFGKATLNAARLAMRQQSPYGDTTKKLGAKNLPRFCVIPADLEETAEIHFGSKSKVTSETTTTIDYSTVTPNIHEQNRGGRKVEIIVVDYWTDAADCALIADPSKVQTIEVGFIGGKEEPELFVQDQRNVGSMFDADKQKWKIKFPYGICFLDHRGFYGFSRA